MAIIPANDGVDADVPVGFRERLRQPQSLAFFVVALLAQVSFGPYYTFFSLYLEQHGYRPSALGAYWAIGVSLDAERLGGVGEVAAFQRRVGLPIDLPARPCVRVDEQRVRAGFGSVHGGGEAGRAAADHHDLRVERRLRDVAASASRRRRRLQRDGHALP